MAGFTPPPPGAMPSGVGAPDMGSIAEEMANADQNSSGAATPSADPKQAMAQALQGRGGAGATAGSQARTPRQITNPVHEVGTLGKDVGQELAEFLPGPLKNILGIKSTDTAAEASRKKKMWQNYQNMSAEQQQLVQKNLQEQEAIRQQKAQEKAQSDHYEQQRRAQASQQVPQGKRTGDQNAGKKSSSQQATAKLQNDRKKLSDPV